MPFFIKTNFVDRENEIRLIKSVIFYYKLLTINKNLFAEQILKKISEISKHFVY